LFDRPKPTVGCSASGRRRRRRIYEVKGVRKLKYQTDKRLREILMRGGHQQDFIQH
jgi:hypothetical protein